MKIFVLLFVCVMTGCGQTPKKSQSELYYATQEKLFKQHSEELAKLGRIPAGFDAYMYMSQYGWHSAHQSSIGNQPILESGGSFGAYTFYQPALEQAKQMWVVDVFILPGSDLLWIKNSNIKFDKSVIGRKIDFLYESVCYKDDGNTPCEEDFKSQSRELRDATIIDVFGHGFEYESWGSDGSHSRGPEHWDGPLKLNKKAPAFMQQYRVEIKPPNWVDICSCTISSEPMPASTKPCTQGGSLAPGESCSVSFSLH